MTRCLPVTRPRRRDDAVAGVACASVAALAVLAAVAFVASSPARDDTAGLLAPQAAESRHDGGSVRTEQGLPIDATVGIVDSTHARVGHAGRFGGSHPPAHARVDARDGVAHLNSEASMVARVLKRRVVMRAHGRVGDQPLVAAYPAQGPPASA